MVHLVEVEGLEMELMRNRRRVRRPSWRRPAAKLHAPPEQLREAAVCTRAVRPSLLEEPSASVRNNDGRRRVKACRDPKR